MSVSSVFACPGGDLIQLVLEKGEGNKMLVADYDKITGMRTYMSPQIRSIKAVMVGDESACTTSSCNQLTVLQGRRVQFQIEFISGTVVNKTIRSVTINPDLGHAKGGVPIMSSDSAAASAEAMIELDINNKQIFGCSIKN